MPSRWNPARSKAFCSTTFSTAVVASTRFAMVVLNS